MDIASRISSDPRLRGVRVAAVAGVAGIAAVAMILFVARPADRLLLFSGLDAAAAGEVVRELDARAVRHEVRGTAIYVDAADRDRLRLELAAQGFPAGGAAGYELLDTLTGFGTTSQMFDAAYLRAKEGELARTIASSPSVRQARVHIAVPGPHERRRGATPRASIFVTTRSDTMDHGQMQGVQHLVASAVAGLTPDAVSVIDGTSGALLSHREGSQTGMPASRPEDVLRDRLLRLLEARVGQGRAFVEVSLDTVQESETRVERIIDPESRVAISSETTETSANSQESATGEVSVASNLPDGDGEDAENSESRRSSEIRERVNYEVSETKREITIGPGAVRRLTVAVLIDAAALGSEDPDADLGALEELIKSASGYSEARGDQVTVRSMALAENTAALPEEIAERSVFLPLDSNRLVQSGLTMAVIVVFGVFVLRPLLRPRPPQPAPVPLPLQTVESAPLGADRTLLSAQAAAPAVTGEVLTRADDDPGPASLAAPPIAQLRSLIDERREEALAVLQQWTREDGSVET